MSSLTNGVDAPRSSRERATRAGVGVLRATSSLPHRHGSVRECAQGLGHNVRLMAPQFFKPYVKSNKNDAADAEVSCEAARRSTMRFVPVKNVEQQARS